jgi:alkyl sulfatase BDS1-like metallo-beta-lactamase superfamily hydrolase
VAQANNLQCQADDTRIAGLRQRTALVWFGGLLARIREFEARYPGAARGQDRPTPDLAFESRLALRAGELELELVAAPGGETIDSCVVWLPQKKTALVSNLFGPLFPHFPNFNTLRGDRYRFPEPYLENVRRVRALGPEMLVTGRHLPIRGAALVDSALARLHDAVDWVHRETLARMNAGQELHQIQREVVLPPKLRVGQGYGKVSWAVRTFWEEYTGWFQRRSSAELYPTPPGAAAAELAALAGTDAVLARARERLAAGDAPLAIELAEAVLAREPRHAAAAALMVDAHQALLDAGGEANFWESGWLQHQRERWRAVSGRGATG